MMTANEIRWLLKEYEKEVADFKECISLELSNYNCNSKVNIINFTEGIETYYIKIKLLKIILQEN